LQSLALRSDLAVVSRGRSTAFRLQCVFDLTTVRNIAILSIMSGRLEKDFGAGSSTALGSDQAPARRDLLLGAAVAGTAGALGRKSGPSASSRGVSRAGSADVLVVGAGLSGLAAGRSVLLLEARDRIGGRMVRRPVIEGGWVDLGGQWVGPTQTKILGLAAELGVRRFESYHDGLSVFYWHGVRSTFAGSFPPFRGQPPQVPRLALLDAEQALAKIDRLSALVPPEAPWLTPGARQFDGQTMQTWLEANTRTPFARFVLTQQALIGGSGHSSPAKSRCCTSCSRTGRRRRHRTRRLTCSTAQQARYPGSSRDGSATASCLTHPPPRSAWTAAA
jgi:hypothetical protein